MKPAAAFLLGTLCLSSCATNTATETEWMPKGGFVGDEKTAVAIAVAVWNPIYGENEISTQKPYTATLLSDNTWHVCGTLPVDRLGGVANAVIAKRDGKILSVWHTQ
ncbi:MAG: YbbC/YhhH family protein [Opitutaceae bacterium]|nr:YbbC/YhhH family protein [Opitutaceae bacterium]